MIATPAGRTRRTLDVLASRQPREVPAGNVAEDDVGELDASLESDGCARPLLATLRVDSALLVLDSTPMTRHLGHRALRHSVALIASAALIVAYGGLPAQGSEETSASASAQSPAPAPTPQERARKERAIVGWAGLTQDAPLAGARVRIFTATGRDITKRLTGFSPTAPCKGDAAVMCTQTYGVVHIPLIAEVPAGAILAVSGGSILGKKVKGALRVRLDVEDGTVHHPTVTLGSTVMLALETDGMTTKEAHRRTLAALGLHRGYSVGFSERHDTPLLDHPGVVTAFTQMGAAAAVEATVKSAIRHPGSKASWLTRAETSRPSRNPRDFEWTAAGVGKWAAGQLAGGIVGAMGGQAFSLFLGAVGFNPEADRMQKLEQDIEAAMSRDFASLRQEMNTGFETISNLVNTQGSAAACQDAKNLVSTGVGQIVSSLSTSDYQEAWNDYVTAVLDASVSQAPVEALFSQMSGWSPATGSQIGLKAYQNAFSPVNGIVSSTSIAAAWQQDLQCLKGSAGDSTQSPLITAKSWPTTDSGSAVVPVSVQLGTYYTGVAARGALLDAVFAAFVQSCGARPAVDGTCPTGAKGAQRITTNDTWSKVYKTGCSISPSQQVGCAGVNYYATLAGSLISPVADGLALDYRSGNWWSMAQVGVDNLVTLGSTVDSARWDLDVSSEACMWLSLAVPNCPSDFALPSRAQMDALVATQATVKALGSLASINLVGMPSTVNASPTTTYADVLHSWYSYHPSSDMGANAACGPSRATAFNNLGVQRSAPLPGVLMGFAQPGGDGATCTGSWGPLIQETTTEVGCPASFGAGDFSGPMWNIHGDGNASDKWFSRDSYQGNSLAMGFGHAQPSTGNSCAGWAFVAPVSLSDWWALLPTGDPANVAATPVTFPAIQQYILDGTTTSSSGYFEPIRGYPHDPSNNAGWEVSPNDGFYAAVRYVGKPGVSPFRADISSNAVALWGSAVPAGFGVYVDTLVVRHGGWEPFLFQDSSSSANETVCPTWDLGQSACGADGHFVATMPGEVAIDLTATSPKSTMATGHTYLDTASALPAVTRRTHLLGDLTG